MSGGGLKGRVLLPVLGTTIFLLVWEAAGRVVGSAILAPPSLVAVEYVLLLRQNQMLPELALSLRQMAIGYAAALLVGMPVGVLMGRSRLMDAALQPWVSMFVVTSTAALIPLLIMLLGTGLWLRVTVVFLATVFYVVLTTYNGARGIPPMQLAAARSFGAGGFQLFWKVMVPSLYPYLLTGARVGFVHAIRAMVTAELFVIVGYGGLIHQTGLSVDTGALLGLLLTLMLASLAGDALLRAAGRWLAPWYEQGGAPR